MKLFHIPLIFFLVFSSVFFNKTFAQEETSIMIRAKAKDAKFIGSSMGGAKIIVRNALTGEILDQGITEGSTGNTQKIFSTDKQRYEPISTENSAGFLAKLKLDKPVLVNIEANAPMNQTGSAITTTTQLWVIPGKDILGDGIILEIPGFVVDILSPLVHSKISGNLKIKARIVMMCGCPITKGGRWDANQYEVLALIKSQGKLIQKINMEVKEKPSVFYGETTLESGNYEMILYAFDPKTGNSGVDKSNFAVE
ncbi:MAG TPA: hypothetical protein VFM65_10860 [Flavobacteriaceae bacterium]|nr:hypothetical protein [Flavobacteriaceae bacterium]